MKRIFIWMAVVLILVFLFSLIFFREISLLHFIDISFYISGGLLTLSLLTMVIQKGFFDAIFFSFRTVFESSRDRQLKEEKTPLSELISFRYNSCLMVGLFLLLIMLAALFFYYL
ncbi:DUF3899 domain-containing protein [Peribacillus cavernae]|uniref:DUF3899 domain-containing protein n=1 Tax=Peribacillus cavernae TaxID=1674310 RepID=A0A3S0TY49_9BACI|nr:DUF3899 domain-containing protein [Peribacillus cavernae]MDQ0217528.1 membrane protein implicated in regulation of membrane protease activity [Peribacillus cavernae]RUQ30034.1 DUF3899 domain-containing protein [Peribacillus cavernae]